MTSDDDLTFIDDLEKLDIDEMSTSSNTEEVGIDGVLSMSEEEISALLNEKKYGLDDDDKRVYTNNVTLEELVHNEQEGSNLGEISSLLQKEKEEIPVDPAIEDMLKGLSDEKLEFTDYENSDLFFENTPDNTHKKKKGKKVRVKKEKTPKTKVPKAKAPKAKAQNTKSQKRKTWFSDLFQKKKENKDVQYDTFSREETLNSLDRVENDSDNEPLIQDVLSDGIDTGVQELDPVDIKPHETSGERGLDFDGVQEFDPEELDSLLGISPSKGEQDAKQEPKEKKGLLEKIKDFLSEEEEEDQDTATEEKPSPKKKKGKKGKKENISEEDFPEESKSKKDNKKKTKEKRPKEKKIRRAADPNEKKFPVKKMLLVLLVFMVIGLGVSVVSSLYLGHYAKQRGVAAYESGNYLECYKNLYGKQMTESQEIMFRRSEINLKMELQKQDYLDYRKDGAFLQGLDHLVQFFFKYDSIYQNAEKWKHTDIVTKTHDELSQWLEEDYGISEEKAKELGAIEDDYDYTRALMGYIQ